MQISAKVLVAVTLAVAFLPQSNLSVAIPVAITPSASFLATISLVLSLFNFVQIGAIYEHLDMLYSWSFWYHQQISITLVHLSSQHF